MADPVFLPGITNPFGLTNVGANSAMPTFVDIDNDGDLDAFVGRFQGGDIRYYQNTGTATNPTYAAPLIDPFGLTSPFATTRPVFVDIDNDGDLDAFVGTSPGLTLFYRNTGTANAPAFAAAVTNPFGLTTGDDSGPAFVDIDGDGDLDAFIGNEDGNTRFYRNTGTANAPAFAAPITNPFGLTDVGTFAKPAFADVDGDGDLDAFIGNTDGNTLFYRNTGSMNAPAFAAPVTNPFGITDVGVFAAPNFADIDGDGDQDLFIGNQDGDTVFFKNVVGINITAGSAPSEAEPNQAPGNFVITLPDPAPAGGLTINYTVEGTATPGVDYIPLPGSVTIPAGATTATIPVNAILDNVVDPGETVKVTLSPVPGFNLGATPIAVLTIADQIPLQYTNRLTNPFGLTDVGSQSNPIFVDIDGDGDLDAFLGNNAGNTLFYRNTGTASTPAFAAPVTNPFGLTDVGTEAAPFFADIDGDGDLDALFGNQPGDTLFYRNIGTATNPLFAAPVTNPFGLTRVGAEATPAFVDIDGDGDLDGLYGDVSGNALFFRNIGTATNPVFAPVQTNPFGLTDAGTFVNPDYADIDGDGDFDLLVGNDPGNLLLYRNTGTPGNPAFAAPVTNPFGLANVGGAYANPAFADIDGDGDLDLFVGRVDGNTVFFENAPLVTVAPGTNAAEPSTNGSFILTLSQPAPDSGITVNYTLGGTATSGVDYFAPASVTFAKGETTATVVIETIDDLLEEPVETITLTVVDGAPYNLGATTTASINLTSDDIFPKVSITPGNAPSEAEPNQAPGSFLVTLVDGPAPAGGLTVNYTVNGTATPGVDYVALTGTVTIPAGASAVDIPVNAILDDVVDPGETVKVTLSAGPGYTLGTSPTAVLAIADQVPLQYTNRVTNPFGLTDVGDFATPTFVDIDNDGDLDAFIGNRAGNTLFYRNTGTTTTPVYAAPVVNPFGLTKVGTSTIDTATPTFVDIDGDGDLDAFIGRRDGGDISFFRNIGTATTPVFAAPVTDPFGLITPGDTTKITFGDIDGDGDLDAFVGNNQGNTLFHRNTGTASNPQFAAPLTNPFGLTQFGGGSSDIAPTLVDIDGDGDLDLFLGRDNGDTGFFRNDGTITNPVFTPSGVNPFGLIDVGDYSKPAFADIDGDGDLDAFIGNSAGNIVFFENAPLVTVAPGANAAEPSTNGSFTLTLSQPAPDSGITVNYTLGGTATPGVDYTAPASVTFAPGQTTATVVIETIDDLLEEPVETITLTVVDGAPYNLGATTTASINLTSDDIFPKVSITPGNAPSEAEPNQAPGSFLVTLVDGPAPAGGLTVNYTVNGTATPGVDYVALTGTVTIPAGASAVDIPVNAILDDVVDPGETVKVTLSAGPGYTLGTSPTAVLAIADQVPLRFTNQGTNPFGLTDVGDRNDPTFADIDGDGDLDAFVGNFQGDTLFYRNTGSSSTPVFAAPVTNPFGITRINGIGASPVLVDIDGDGDLDLFVGKDGNAAVGDGGITFFRNDGTTTTPSFTLVGDNPFGFIRQSDDLAPTFVDIDGDGDLDAFVGTWNQGIKFYRNTGDATNPSFAAPVTDPFGIDPSSNYQTPEFGDVDGDGDLDLFVTTNDGNTRFYRNIGTITNPNFAAPVTNPFGFANTGSGFTRISLTDIDGDGDLDAFVGLNNGNTVFYENAPLVTVARGANAAEPSTNGSFTLTLSQPAPDGGITVNYTLGGTATPGVDYTSPTGSVTIPKGETTATVVIEPIDDLILEPTETITLTVNDGVQYNLGATTSASINLFDNDVPGISISDVTVNEGNSGTTPAIFNVTLSQAFTQPVTVNYSTQDETALGGSDYVVTSGSLTFAPGEVSKPITVSVLGDTLVEPDETFKVILSSPTGAAIVDGEGIGTIANDDNAPPPGLTPLISGTSFSDRLTGTDASEYFLGGDGADIITTGGGRDIIFYTSLLDGSDVIADFELGQDQISITNLVRNVGLSPLTFDSAISGGFLGITDLGQQGALVTFDRDGINGSEAAVSLALVRNVNANQLRNSSNFSFAI